MDCTDSGEATASDPRTDCNDASAAVSPAATEYCNSLDDDCDSLVDDADPGRVGGSTWYPIGPPVPGGSGHPTPNRIIHKPPALIVHAVALLCARAHTPRYIPHAC